MAALFHTDILPQETSQGMCCSELCYPAAIWRRPEFESVPVRVFDSKVWNMTGLFFLGSQHHPPPCQRRSLKSVDSNDMLRPHFVLWRTQFQFF